VTAQNYPILEIDATIGRSIGQVTGTFELRKSSVETGVRTGPLVENQFATLITQLGNIFDGGEAGRRGITLDGGGGQHYYELDLEGIGEDDGQWGYSNDADVLDEATATGGDRVQKVQVLMNYLRKGQPNSFTPARLKYGEYAPSGVMPEDHLDVYIEDPNAVVDRGEASVFTSSLTLIETVDLGEAITETARTD